MIEQPPNDPLDRCNVSACHRAGECVFHPCRAPASTPEHPNVGITVLGSLIFSLLGGYIVWWL